MKRFCKWVAIAFAVCLTAGAIGVWVMFGSFVQAANRVEKLEDGLYAMTLVGDDGFDAFLAAGGADSDSAVAAYLTSFLSRGFYKQESSVETGGFGCATLYTQDESGRSVVVEYVSGEMLVTDTMVVTNHYPADCEKQGIGSAQSHKRYEMLAAHTGTADAAKSAPCWKAWRRRTSPRRQTATRRPCGASSIVRRSTARTSISRRTMDTAMN